MKILAIIVGACIFAGVLITVGLHNTWDALRQADLLCVSLTFAALVMSSFVRIFKWSLIRDRMGARIGLTELSGIYFSSKFWGLVSPMRSGEVAPVLLRSGKDAQRGRLLSLILFDRVIETFQSLAVFFCLFFLLYGVFFNIKTGYALVGISLMLACLCIFLFSRKAGDKIFDFIEISLVPLRGRGISVRIRGWLKKIKEEMDEFYLATKSYFTIWFVLYILILTFLAWGIDMLSFWILFKAFSINTSVLITVTSIMIYSMASALAPIPGGLGVSDLTFALIMGFLGFKGEAGGIIIVSRILVTSSVFFGYTAFNTGKLDRRPAPK